MAKINIRPDEMVLLSQRLGRISSVIQDAENITRKVQSNLDFEVAAKQDIAGQLRSARTKLHSQYNKVSELARLTAVSNEEFMTADGQMDKNARNILRRISTPVAGVIHKMVDFFAGVDIARYALTSALFFSTGSVVASVGLSELMLRLRKITGKTPTGGITGGGNTGGTEPVTTTPPVQEPVKKPPVVNTGSSKQNAENAGLTYYTQGKGYNKYWNGKAWIGSNGTNYDYKKSLACGICCDAMVAAYFGANLTPGNLLQANGGSASWNGTGVKNAMAQHGITSQTVAKNSESTEAKVNKLDECLEKYRNDPAHNAPPMISIYNKNNKDANHYVMVVGKDENGDYIIVDPANDDRTILKVKTEGYGKTMANKKGYESCIKNVIAWTKN